MKSQTKLVTRITFDEYDAELLIKAARLAQKFKSDEELEPRQMKWFIQWCVRAVSEAVVRAGMMPCPLGVEMRYETKEETAKRTGDELPQPTAPAKGKTEPDAAQIALKYFQSRFWSGKNVTLEYIARHIFREALGRPSVVEEWLNATSRYCDAEGFTDAWPLVNGRIKSRKEYRRVKL